MYLQHFGFNRHPFRMAPEEDFLYMSHQHSRAFVFMDSAIWSPEGFVVISGEIGSGKTTLLKKMISGIREEVKLFHIAFTNLKGDDLFRFILQQADITPKQDDRVSMLFEINNYLLNLSEHGMPVLLAIDEAQNLSHDNLEDIRMMAGMEGPNGPILRVILLGQPELKNHVAKIPQLTQRVKLFFHLEGLSHEDTQNYVIHRLNIAGYHEKALFNPPLIQQIYHHSQGIPRMINKICDGLLLCAYAEDRHYLQSSDIDEIRDELLVPNQDETQKSLPSTGSSPQENTAETGSPNALERIALALESINQKLELLSSEEQPRVKLFEDARKRLQKK